MPPIEFGQGAAGSARPVGAVRAEPAVQPAASAVPSTAANQTPVAAVQKSPALDPGRPPVDDNRVSEIRNAIQKGTYPLLPTKVADAMIAAGLMLSTKA